MSARLRADPQYMRRELGDAFVDQLTYPGIFRGAPLSATPVLVERGGKRTVVINDADSQATRVLLETVATVRYGRYFTWDADSTQLAPSFAEAVRHAAGVDVLVCDAHIPEARYDALAATGPVDLADTPPIPIVHTYRKSIAEIEAQWISTREADCAPFADYLADFPHAAPLTEALYARAEGFAPLDRLCRTRRLDALCVTAPYEVEALTGLPDAMAAAHGLIAIYVTGADAVTVCAVKPLIRKDFVAQGEPRPLSDVLSGIGTIAAQKNDMAASLWRPLTAAGVRLTEGDHVLRRWQDCRAGDDFGYFLFAANAVLEGIAAARALFKRAASAPLTERDLVAAHHEGVRGFARRFGFDGRVASYFDIVHSGARTLLPATAADYPVSRDDRTVALDLGIVVRDAAGCVRAVSDIARSFCAAPELSAIADALRTTLVDKLIPQIRPGLTGEEVHAIGVECLRPLEPDLRRAGLLPEGKGVADYRRDCGHAMHRQTVSSVYFMPGNRETLEEGMLGCVEYVWPIGDVLIGVEEGYVVTRQGTFPFTREVVA